MFKKKSSWAIRAIIVEERAEGGLEFSEDLARRWKDRNMPGKVFYELKKRKVKTRPSFYSNLIPGPQGKKILFFYAISPDELYPIEFKNIKKINVHVTDAYGNKLYYETKPIQVVDKDGKPLFYKVDDEGKAIKETTIKKTEYPVIERYEIAFDEEKQQAVDKKGNPLFYKVDKKGNPTEKLTTKQTDYMAVAQIIQKPRFTIKPNQYPVMQEKETKLVTPTPADLRYWLARTQEEDKFKYEYKNWWDKWGGVIQMSVLGGIILLAILFTFYGINEMIGTIEQINGGLNNIAQALQSTANQLEGFQGIQQIRTVGTGG